MLPEALVWRRLGKEPFCTVFVTFWTTTEERARPLLLKQPVCGGWDERAVGHAACLLGGARDRGSHPVGMSQRYASSRRIRDMVLAKTAG